MFTLIVFILVLSVLVFVHEFGHFWMARRFGVKAEEFGFGFPPRLIGVYKNVEGKWKIVKGNKEVKDAVSTVYSLNWIPLGGFVKIKGENGEDAQDEDSFGHKKIWQRILILSAGVLMNVVLTVVLLSVGYMIGLPQSLSSSLPSSAQVKDVKIQIMEVLPESPAEKAGLKPRDIILSINNQSFVNVDQMLEFLKDKQGQTLTYKIKRGDQIIEKQIKPIELSKSKTIGVGISVLAVGKVKYPWYLAWWQGLRSTIALLWMIIVAFFNLLVGLFKGAGVASDLAGPVGIAQLTGQAARMGFVYLLQFSALLSANLAVINFVPIPALDGGRVMFLILEKIKGRPMKQELEAVIHNIFFALLILLIIIITYRDIARLHLFR
jgi:regulator of sigma E protease